MICIFFSKKKGIRTGLLLKLNYWNFLRWSVVKIGFFPIPSLNYNSPTIADSARSYPDVTAWTNPKLFLLDWMYWNPTNTLTYLTFYANILGYSI